MKKVVTAMVVASSLASCASIQIDEEITALEERLRVLAQPSDSYLEFNWIGEEESAGTPEIEAAVERAADCIQPKSRDFAERSARLHDAAQSLPLNERYLAARQMARQGEAMVQACAEREGLSGKVVFIVDWIQKYSFVEWLDQMHRVQAEISQKRRDLDSARSTEMIVLHAFAAGLGGMSGTHNDSTVPVRSYIRRDGTIVNRHIRTAPNAYCSDNYSGCR